MAKYRVSIGEREYVVMVQEIQEHFEDGRDFSETTGVSRGSLETGGTEVVAPLSGLIVFVKVKVGTRVREGDTLISLEALKLETEISAPIDGIVQWIVSVGETIEAGQPLAIIS